MNDKETNRFPDGKKPRLPAALLLAILAAGVLFAWWMAARADRAMRADLLQQARLVAQAVNVARVQTLSGTETDLASPDYRRLKEQFAAVRSANPRCRFVYLVGRKADGTVFFFLDSEPAGSKDYSPPGQIYEEVSADFLRVFEAKTAAVEGPSTDRWGVWVSALVPLTNPQTGAVVAVLGMDIDAHAWKWDVAARAALPVGLMLVLLIGVAAVFVSARRVEASPKPILRRLLPPLAAMVMILMAGAGALLWQQHRQRLAGDIAAHVSEVSGDLRVALEQQASVLAAVLQPIAADANVRRALRDGDADRLLADWRPMFETLRRENNLTHFYFFDKNRVCLLRVYNPEKRGGLNNRFTALEAERTGKTASGIDLGSLVTFTLRVVQPVFEGSALAGYVELGKEIEGVLQAMHIRSGSQLAMVIRKEHLNRQAWEEGMRLLGREADWDRLPRSVVIYASQGRLPDAFAPIADHDPTGGHAHGETDRDIASDGKDWRVSATPLQDASGQEVGDLLVMRDITAEKAAFARLITLGGTAGAVLLALLLGFIYFLLRRTDADIRAQQAELRESEEQLSATLRSIGDGVIACDDKGNVVSLNAVAEALTGWNADEARGRPIAEVFRIVHAETRQEAEIPVGCALREDRIIGLANHTVLVARDGTVRQIADSCAPIHDSAGVVIGAVLVFRDVTEEYRRREQLRESEEQLRILNNNLSVGVAMIGPDMKILAINPRIRQWFPGADPTGHPPCYDALNVPPQNEICTGCPVAETLRDGRVHVAEREVSTCDEKRYFRMTATAITDRDGKVTAAVEMIDDITERKQAEEALRESNERFQLAINATEDGLWEWDIQTNQEFFAPHWCEIVGYSVDDPEFPHTFKSWATRIHPDDYDHVMDAMSNHLKNGVKYDVDYRHRHKSGEYRWQNSKGQASFDASGKPAKMVGCIRDITERKRAEEALRETNAYLENLINYANAPIIVWDPQFRITRFNHAFEFLIGRSEAEVLGQSLEILFPPALASHSMALIRSTLTGERWETVEIKILHRDESVRTVLWNSATLFASDGQTPLATIAQGQDITARKRAEEDLLETNRQLEEAIARANTLAVQAEMASIAKGQFLANMSHEIRTPMNGVIGMTGLLLDTELNEEQRRYAGIVRASGESLLGLINDVLDFSKIEAKKLDLETLDFDLSSLLDDFAATLAVRAHEKGLELLCAADPSVPVLLRGDPGRLRQILTNLAGNAVKFTHTGEVAVRVALVEESEHLSPEPLTLNPSVLLRFSVRDTGIGIPKDKIGLLFNKFSQVDASITRQYGGTGLGLSISKQLAELMSGEVGVESPSTSLRAGEGGPGSEFWFTARLGRQAEGAQAESSTPANLRDIRVLIVDDNATNREILITRLTSWGMRPAETADGPGALQALHRAQAENDPFRLAVLDMQMPGMDGATLGRAIKADARLADTRMVMLTSLGTRGDARRFAGIGFAAYTTKPIRHEELKAVLSLALTERAGAAAQPIVTRHTARETLNRFEGRKARILLAEDNITNQQVALGILRKLGLRADAVANGAEALKALETIPYDLVLMDVQMPVMDGLEATRAIRNPQSAIRNHQVPVIAMTAHAMQGDREKCLEAGMNDYVSKPVATQALAEALEKWLPEAKAEGGKMKDAGGEQKKGSSLILHPSSLVFDRAGVMARLMDDETLARKVAEGFLADIPRQIEALRGYLEAGDAPTAERQAHSIKGAAATVGGEALRAVAGEMEKAAKAGDLSAVKARLGELEAEFGRLKQALKKEF